MSKREDYKTITEDDLYPGNILPIYKNWRSQEDLLGYAVLNHTVNSTLDVLPYIRAEIGKGDINEPDAIIFSFLRWNITYIDPKDYPIELTKEEKFSYNYLKGFTTNWNISYYVDTNSNHPSYYKRSWWDND